MCLKLTHNPEAIVFDLVGEAFILVDPPVYAALAGVVWEYSLSRPYLKEGYKEINKECWDKTLRTIVWHWYCIKSPSKHYPP